MEINPLSGSILDGRQQPEALQDAILALSGSSDPRIKAIEKQVFNDLQSPAERSAVTLRAAEWSACMNGKADCGPYNHEADSDCIYLGECYSHLSRMDYLRTRALSGQQYSQMQRYLQLLNSQVLHRR